MLLNGRFCESFCCHSIAILTGVENWQADQMAVRFPRDRRNWCIQACANDASYVDWEFQQAVRRWGRMRQDMSFVAITAHSGRRSTLFK